MKVRARFFASSRDAVGHRELEVELPDGATAQDLVARLVSDYPRLAAHTGSLMLAVNEAYVEPGRPLAPGDEVALIPPVSGG